LICTTSSRSRESPAKEEDVPQLICVFVLPGAKLSHFRAAGCLPIERVNDEIVNDEETLICEILVDIITLVFSLLALCSLKR
jgi:hypothetical protein